MISRIAEICESDRELADHYRGTMKDLEREIRTSDVHPTLVQEWIVLGRYFDNSPEITRVSVYDEMAGSSNKNVVRYLIWRDLANLDRWKEIQSVLRLKLNSLLELGNQIKASKRDTIVDSQTRVYLDESRLAIRGLTELGMEREAKALLEQLSLIEASVR